MIVCGWCDQRPALAFFGPLKAGKGKPQRFFLCLRCRPIVEKRLRDGVVIVPEVQEVVP